MEELANFAATQIKQEEIDSADGEQFEVEDILQWHWTGSGENREREFLVKWLGYPKSEATWEPESNLQEARDVLDKFLRRKRLALNPATARSKSGNSNKKDHNSAQKQSQNFEKIKSELNERLGDIDQRKNQEEGPICSNSSSLQKTPAQKKSTSIYAAPRTCVLCEKFTTDNRDVMRYHYRKIHDVYHMSEVVTPDGKLRQNIPASVKVQNKRRAAKKVYKIYPVPRSCPFKCPHFQTIHPASFSRHLKLVHQTCGSEISSDLNSEQQQPKTVPATITVKAQCKKRLTMPGKSIRHATKLPEKRRKLLSSAGAMGKRRLFRCSHADCHFASIYQQNFARHLREMHGGTASFGKPSSAPAQNASGQISNSNAEIATIKMESAESLSLPFDTIPEFVHLLSNINTSNAACKRRKPVKLRRKRFGVRKMSEKDYYPIPRGCPKCPLFSTRHRSSLRRHLLQHNLKISDVYGSSEETSVVQNVAILDDGNELLREDTGSSSALSSSTPKFNRKTTAKIQKKWKKCFYLKPRTCPLCLEFSTKDVRQLFHHLNSKHGCRISDVFFPDGTLKDANVEALRKIEEQKKQMRQNKDQSLSLANEILAKNLENDDSLSVEGSIQAVKNRRYDPPRTCPLCSGFTTDISSTLSSHMTYKHNCLVSDIFFPDGTLKSANVEMVRLKQSEHAEKATHCGNNSKNAMKDEVMAASSSSGISIRQISKTILSSKGKPTSKTWTKGANWVNRFYVKPRTCPICREITTVDRKRFQLHLRKHNYRVSEVFHQDGSLRADFENVAQNNASFSDTLIESSAEKTDEKKHGNCYAAPRTCPLCCQFSTANRKELQRHLLREHKCRTSDVFHHRGELRQNNIRKLRKKQQKICAPNDKQIDEEKQQPSSSVPPSLTEASNESPSSSKTPMEILKELSGILEPGSEAESRYPEPRTCPICEELTTDNKHLLEHHLSSKHDCEVDDVFHHDGSQIVENVEALKNSMAEKERETISSESNEVNTAGEQQISVETPTNSGAEALPSSDNTTPAFSVYRNRLYLTPRACPLCSEFATQNAMAFKDHIFGRHKCRVRDLFNKDGSLRRENVKAFRKKTLAQNETTDSTDGIESTEDPDYEASTSIPSESSSFSEPTKKLTRSEKARTCPFCPGFSSADPTIFSAHILQRHGCLACDLFEIDGTPKPISEELRAKAMRIFNGKTSKQVPIPRVGTPRTKIVFPGIIPKKNKNTHQQQPQILKAIKQEPLDEASDKRTENVRQLTPVRNSPSVSGTIEVSSTSSIISNTGGSPCRSTISKSTDASPHVGTLSISPGKKRTGKNCNPSESVKRPRTAHSEATTMICREQGALHQNPPPELNYPSTTPQTFGRLSVNRINEQVHNLLATKNQRLQTTPKSVVSASTTSAPIDQQQKQLKEEPPEDDDDVIVLSHKTTRANVSGGTPKNQQQSTNEANSTNNSFYVCQSCYPPALFASIQSYREHLFEAHPPKMVVIGESASSTPKMLSLPNPPQPQNSHQQQLQQQQPYVLTSPPSSSRRNNEAQEGTNQFSQDSLLVAQQHQTPMRQFIPQTHHHHQQQFLPPSQSAVLPMQQNLQHQSPSHQQQSVVQYQQQPPNSNIQTEHLLFGAVARSYVAGYRAGQMLPGGGAGMVQGQHHGHTHTHQHQSVAPFAVYPIGQSAPSSSSWSNGPPENSTTHQQQYLQNHHRLYPSGGNGSSAAVVNTLYSLPTEAGNFYTPQQSQPQGQEQFRKQHYSA